MKKIITSLFLLSLSYTYAQNYNSVTLVKNINPNGPSSTNKPAVFNGKFYFSADNGVNGEQLWTSDGTEDGTTLVKVINPAGNADITNLMVVNDKLVFSAYDPINGIELWISDGTETGTVLLKDINPGAENSVPLYFTRIGNKVYFQADNGTDGYELWATDGTANGTVMVLNINPNATENKDSYPYGFTEYNGKVYFQADNSTNGYELWSSDGTAAGTVMVKDVFTTGDSSPRSFKVYNNLLYFRADDERGDEIWVTDGTTEGTVFFADLNLAEADGSSVNEFTEAAGKLFFRARNAEAGSELWVTDGTVAGTVMVKDIFPGAGDSFPAGITAYNGKVYFQATDANNDTELWSSDGTEAGTQIVKNIRPATSSAPNELFVYNNALYFVANDGTNGRELWVTDGTEAGTIKPIQDAYSQDPLYYIPYFTVFNGELYFKATYQGVDQELFKLTAGTMATPGVVKNIAVVYPNPAANSLNIQLHNAAVQNVEVFTLTGKKVLQSNGQSTINVTNLSKGLYIVKTTTDRNETFYNKIVKE
jgi:ELWxxDGT repeat protein